MERVPQKQVLGAKEVDLRPLFLPFQELNRVEDYLIRIAEKHPSPQVLNGEDFVRGISEGEWVAFVAAAEDYMGVRRDGMREKNWVNREETLREAEIRFWTAIGAIRLPENYLPDRKYKNPPAMPPHVGSEFFGFLGSGTSRTEIQNRYEADWQFETRGFGFSVMGGLPKTRRFSVGLFSHVMESKGKVFHQGEQVGKVDHLGVSLSGLSKVHFFLHSAVIVFVGGGFGFELGRYEFDRTDAGRAKIESPCAFSATGTFENLPTTEEEVQEVDKEEVDARREQAETTVKETVDEASDSITCRIKNTVGGYTTFVQQGLVEFLFWDALKLGFHYRHANPEASKVQIIPKTRQDFMLTLGVRFP